MTSASRCQSNKRALVATALVLVGSAALLSACGFRDSQIAEQREIVEEVFQSIEWPQVYEQRPFVERRDPNLDSLNRQPGTITVGFIRGGRPLAQVRDDFDRALGSTGFMTDFGRCDGESLMVSYYSDVHLSIFPNLFVGRSSSESVFVQLFWTVPSGEPAVRVSQPLPECP